MDTAVNVNKRRLGSTTDNIDGHDDAKRANTNRILPVTLLSGFLG